MTISNSKPTTLTQFLQNFYISIKVAQLLIGLTRTQIKRNCDTFTFRKFWQIGCKNALGTVGECRTLRIKAQILTFKIPNKYKVGSTPTEKIIRSIIHAIRVMILDGVAMVITSARDANMPVHTSPESLVSNSTR